jgi:hypothetical protein
MRCTPFQMLYTPFQMSDRAHCTCDMQACLGIRPDVIVMDQEVMGYDWYIPRVRRRHTSIVFPPGVRLRPVGPPGI